MKDLRDFPLKNLLRSKILDTFKNMFTWGLVRG